MTTIPVYASGPTIDVATASAPIFVIEVPPRAVPVPAIAPSQVGWYEEALAEWKAAHSGREPGEIVESEVAVRPRWRHLKDKLDAAAELRESGWWGRLLNWVFPLVS